MFGFSNPPRKKIPACRYLGSTSVANGVLVGALAYATRQWQDPGFLLEPSSTRVRVAQQGRYKVTLRAHCINMVNVFQFQFWVNNAQARLYSGSPHNSGGYYWQISFTCTIFLNAGDYIETYMDQFSGSTQTIDYALTMLKVA